MVQSNNRALSLHGILSLQHQMRVMYGVIDTRPFIGLVPDPIDVER